MQIDAGAELVVTQLFYDVDQFIQYEKDCRSIGIDCPIIPGIFPSFLRTRVAIRHCNFTASSRKFLKRLIVKLALVGNGFYAGVRVSELYNLPNKNACA